MAGGRADKDGLAGNGLRTAELTGRLLRRFSEAFLRRGFPASSRARFASSLVGKARLNVYGAQLAGGLLHIGSQPAHGQATKQGADSGYGRSGQNRSCLHDAASKNGARTRPACGRGGATLLAIQPASG